MKCPACENDFEFTWRRYAESGAGRFPCPVCGARLWGRHRWFYWVLLPAAVLVAMLVAAALGMRFFGVIGTMVLALIAGFAVGLPLDRFMESRFGVLVLDPRVPSNAERDARSGKAQ